MILCPLTLRVVTALLTLLILMGGIVWLMTACIDTTSMHAPSKKERTQCVREQEMIDQLLMDQAMLFDIVAEIIDEPITDPCVIDCFDETQTPEEYVACIRLCRGM